MDYLPTQVQVTDTVPILWFKTAQAFQAYAGVTYNGSIESSPASADNQDESLNLLRAAYAMQFLI